MTSNQFGRVDGENNVFVIDGGVERQIGQYPNVSAEEAIAYFSRKFDDLEAQVRTLEQRIAAGVSDAKSLKTGHDHLVAELVAPNVFGNIQNLRDRLAKLSPSIAEAAAKISQEIETAIAEALVLKEEIAAKAEAIVAKLESVNWKKSAPEMTALFESWQKLQKEGPKVPKSQTDPIWKRFSQARAKFESGRRAYFSTLDSKFKEAKAAKAKLAEAAEALVAKGSDAAADYRKLQDQWKLAPKAGKVEDALWARFRAAGDAIFAAKKEKDAELAVAHAANLKAKQELLVEAEKIAGKDIEADKKLLADIQARWVKIGHVAKDEVRKLEDKLRKFEKIVADAQADAWRRSDPAAKARSNSLVTQLEAVIAELEAELKGAAAAKKKDIQSQIDARKAWLEAAQKAVD
ncbi:MAG: DUF349 domain-containing protein [Aquiluna sp.]|nr:DUF349 domain-containing protein [Aquiluna sp.]MCF8545098.1 DUF349 domain-containing protein [Aquiluna sp.]